jgi:hypothetical protein
MGIFLHRLSFERREYQHRDLIPGLLLVSFEPSIQLFRVVPRQRTGKVHNATRHGGTSSAERSSGFSRNPKKTTTRAGSRQTRLMQRRDIMQQV